MPQSATGVSREGAPQSDDTATETKTVAAPKSTFTRFALGYWRDSGRNSSITLIVAIALTLALTLGINYAYNLWNRVFFDAIGSKNADAIWQALLWLPAIVIVGAGLAALMSWLKLTLQLQWRTYLTRRLMALWLGDQRYYRIGLMQNPLNNVEHRIAEDVRQAVEPAVELSVGFVWSVTNALLFIGVLITVGGSASIMGVTVPGYIAVAALLYAATVTGAVTAIGRRLAAKVAEKNEREAQFRYEITRVRENAESIAFLRGDARELAAANTTWAALRTAFVDVIKVQRNVTWVTNANSFLAPVLPAVLAAPKYISGELTLGGVMQIVAAFAAVLGALNWFSDNFLRLSDLNAAATRAGELAEALQAVDVGHVTSGRPAAAALGNAIELRDVTLRKQDGSALIQKANVVVMPGERVLIEGRSGSGKSTLLRSLAGFWPWAEGEMSLPKDAKISFLPQRPYIPIGRLVDALTYPRDIEMPDEEATRLLKLVGLEHLAPQLNDTASWDTILSGGERQRIGFARVLSEMPDIIVLDEATSALDDASQSEIFQTLVDALPNATILNVAHRQGLQKFHDRKLVIGKGDNRGAVRSTPTAALSMSGLVSLVKRGLRARREPPQV